MITDFQLKTITILQRSLSNILRNSLQAEMRPEKHYIPGSRDAGNLTSL